MNPKNKFFSRLFVLLAAAVLVYAVSCRSEPGPKPAEKPARQKPGKTDTASLLLRISELQAKGDYEGALALFDAIDPREGEKKEIRLLKASACLSAGRIGEGSSIAKEILAGEPEDVPALLVLSAAEEASGRTKEQRALLERILKLENANVPALVSMGNLLVRTNSTRLAGPYYDRALAAEPDNGEALLGRAWVYRNNRDPKSAEALLNKAVTLYPQWAMPLHERGRLYKSAGFPREALADLDKARALEPDNYFIACDRGSALSELNRKTEALAEFERALKINPEYFLAYVYTAGIKDELGDYNGAERDYEKLTLLNPDYYFAFEGLGMHLMRRGDWLAAKDAFVEAYKRAKTDEGTYALLAAVNWMRGGKLQDPKLLLEEVLRKVPRDSLEYWMLRLYHDLVGDGDIVIRIDKEKNGITKARMLYYLANYYDIRGNKRLADRYFLQVRELNVKGIPEWRLNEWALEERGLALKVN
ncbi:MAG: tetratricopeptide repeat protein [Treponema sp.]|jgi:tetratricopeptide (TPR) repeat protein|nr:tetratricopeptide repeat protein [Treponema sp.]